MLHLKMLPFFEGVKEIIIDEGKKEIIAISFYKTPSLSAGISVFLIAGEKAMYSESLIAAWLPVWKERYRNRQIELLLFGCPRHAARPHPFNSSDIRIHDYYTTNANGSEILNTEDLLRTAMENLTNRDSIVIIDCLSSLILLTSLVETCKFVSRLSSKAGQLICIYRRDFGIRRIPSVETLGTTYVRLERSHASKLNANYTYEATLLHRKAGGGILRRTIQAEQNTTSYEIESEKFVFDTSTKSDRSMNGHPEKVVSSFRIEMNAREMEQRNETPLPYTFPSHVNPATDRWKILYHPDDVDDFDEEDPDDDLDF